MVFFLLKSQIILLQDYLMYVLGGFSDNFLGMKNNLASHYTYPHSSTERHFPLLIPYLGHSCKVFPDSGQWVLLAHLEIDVNQLVRESRELVGEAGLVFSGHVGCECVAVVLLFDLFIQLVFSRSGEGDVDVIVATSNNLKPNNLNPAWKKSPILQHGLTWNSSVASVPFSISSKKHSFALSGSSNVSSTALARPRTANEAARAAQQPRRFIAAVG